MGIQIAEISRQHTFWDQKSVIRCISQLRKTMGGQATAKNQKGPPLLIQVLVYLLRKLAFIILSVNSRLFFTRSEFDLWAILLLKVVF